MNVLMRCQYEVLVLGKIIGSIAHGNPYRFSLLWKQLKFSDGVLWREYKIYGFGVNQSVILVPIKM